MSNIKVKNIEIVNDPDIPETYYRITYENNTSEESGPFVWHDDLLISLIEKIDDIARNYNYRW